MIRVNPPEDLNPTTKQHPRTMLQAFPSSEPEAMEHHTDTAYQCVEAIVMLAAVGLFFGILVTAPAWWPL